MATQLSLFAFYMAPLVLAWLSLALELGPLSELAGHHRSVLLLLAPLVLVVLLGLYALLSVLYGVATFNDCAQARNELINVRREKLLGLVFSIDFHFGFFELILPFFRKSGAFFNFFAQIFTEIPII